MIKRVTGGELSIEPYLTYLWGKYKPLYDLSGDPMALPGA
jgi:hypothetical protein